MAWMRIATWNVNSLRARLEKVTWWLERARPDVLLMQETKLADTDTPADVFRAAGYELVHHGEGRWNGVAIATRVGASDVVANFGTPLRPAATPDIGDDEPLAEARMVSAVCGGVRVVSVYAPNGRVVDSRRRSNMPPPGVVPPGGVRVCARAVWSEPVLRIITAPTSATRHRMTRLSHSPRRRRR